MISRFIIFIGHVEICFPFYHLHRHRRSHDGLLPAEMRVPLLQLEALHSPLGRLLPCPKANRLELRQQNDNTLQLWPVWRIFSVPRFMPFVPLDKW